MVYILYFDASILHKTHFTSHRELISLADFTESGKELYIVYGLVRRSIFVNRRCPALDVDL